MFVRKYNPKVTHEVKGTLFNFFLLPVLFALFAALLKADISNFIIFAVSFVLFYLSRKLSREGFINEYEYNQLSVAKKPKPLKFAGATVLMIATSFTSYFAGSEGLFVSLFLGVASIVGFYLYYGFDPLSEKSIESEFGVSTAEVVEAISLAKSKIATIESKVTNIRDVRLEKKINFALSKSHLIVQKLEQNPSSLWSGRKFLYVYLDGIIKVVNSYNQVISSHDLSDDMKIELYLVFDKADKTFDAELERLREQKDLDLSIDMEVLKRRLGERDE